jgi:hypothetical protein
MKKTTLFPIPTIMIIMMLIMAAFISPDGMGIITLRSGPRHHLCAGPFDDPLKLSFFEPNTPALRAVIDLRSLSFRHQQLYIAYRTVHDSLRNLEKISMFLYFLDIFVLLQVLFDGDRLILWLQEMKGGALFENGLGRSEAMKGV